MSKNKMAAAGTQSLDLILIPITNEPVEPDILNLAQYKL
jgi:hypothetical protein